MIVYVATALHEALTVWTSHTHTHIYTHTMRFGVDRGNAIIECFDSSDVLGCDSGPI